MARRLDGIYTDCELRKTHCTLRTRRKTPLIMIRSPLHQLLLCVLLLCGKSAVAATTATPTLQRPLLPLCQFMANLSGAHSEKLRETLQKIGLHTRLAMNQRWYSERKRRPDNFTEWIAGASFAPL